MIIGKKNSLPGGSFLFHILIGLLITSVQALAEEQSYFYREQTGELINEYQLVYTTKGPYQSITSKQEQKLFTALCHQDGSTVYWSFEDDFGDKVTARVIGENVQIFGRVDGKIIDSIFSLDGEPWYQPLSYSLRKLLDNSSKTHRFWTIRPDTFTPVLLQANKLECETIRLDGDEVDACRVEISKSGLMSAFWSASYWFRQSDGLFVQYRGTHGLPGTDETMIELIFEKPTGQISFMAPKSYE
jgi:hypothetical protein